MASDIYVQITAAQRATGRSRTVVVLVTASALALQSAQDQESPNPIQPKAVAKKLAEPFAKYAFTHRTLFDDYDVSYAFYEEMPSELRGKEPHWTQDGLWGWLLG
jgi:hypothetical protein